MNIAIILSQKFNPTEGGVQRSTSKLADIFKGLGHNVIIMSLVKGKLQDFRGIPVLHLGINKLVKHSPILEQVLIKYEIDVVLNQNGFSTRMTRLIKKSSKEEVKLINTLRINPLNFVQNSPVFLREYLNKRGVGFLYSKLLLIPLRIYHRIKQWLNHRYILHQVDAYVMLNKSFIEELEYFWIDTDKYRRKLFAIPNPFQLPLDLPSISEKENVILFVGRLNITQKRVDLLLKIWEKLHDQLPDWQFWVVGDGPERVRMEGYCKNNDMSHVHFYGYDDPEPYYRKAKILHFTSAFEGFGNVLVEAQSHGTIPVLFDSYSATGDIIENNRNGFLIHPFSVDAFVNKTLLLTNDTELQLRMSENSRENAKRYNYKAVGRMWENLFNLLK